MKHPIFKGLYRGHGIYRHGDSGYGDETNALCKTVAVYKARIDRKLQEEEASKPACLRYWNTLPHGERERWRKLSIGSELSAPELAYANFVGQEVIKCYTRSKMD